MALQKQNLPVNFSQGLDQKTDPFQVQPGKFLTLENSVFTKGGLLQKRNGFQNLPALPDTTYTYVNTFNDNLLAIGTNVSALDISSNTWVTKGSIVPLKIETLPLVRTSSNQSQVDSVIAPNGLICTVYTNTSPSTTYNYVISDSVTGQNIISTTLISTPSESPRVFLLSNYFVIVYSESANIKYISIPINNPSSPISAVTLITNYAPGALTQPAFDGIVFNNSLYVAYNATDAGGSIRISYLNSFLVRQTASTGVVVDATNEADMISLASNTFGGVNYIWVSFYLTSGTLGYTLAVDNILNVLLASTQFVAAGTLKNITSTATTNRVNIFYELSNTYSYGASLASNIVVTRTCTVAGVLGTATNILRSVGLASKAFLIDSTSYMLTAYSSTYQPSYFLIDGTGKIISKLAYSNGGGYLTKGLPSVTVTDAVAQVSYLIKDMIIAANKSQNPASNTPVYTQTGINLVSFDFNSEGMNASEIGGNLNISGGLLWTYDGTQVVEEGFNVYPDNVIVTTSAAGGNLADQTYYYQAMSGQIIREIFIAQPHLSLCLKSLPGVEIVQTQLKFRPYVSLIRHW